MCISDTSRDKIIKNMFEIKETVQKTIKTIKILTTDVKYVQHVILND